MRIGGDFNTFNDPIAHCNDYRNTNIDSPSQPDCNDHRCANRDTGLRVSHDGSDH